MSYNRKALRVDLGKYYKPNPYKKDIITDPAGQWKYPGQVTRIPGNQITMQGVPYPVYGQDDTGFAQMMYPGQEYVFPGNYVDEYPQMKVGGIPELPLTAGRKAYHAWGYTNNDFIANRQDGGYIEAELTPEEIEEYRKGGYVVEELPKAQLGISDPNEYAYRKKMYDDSLNLYNQTQKYLTALKHNYSLSPNIEHSKSVSFDNIPLRADANMLTYLELPPYKFSKDPRTNYIFTVGKDITKKDYIKKGKDKTGIQPTSWLSHGSNDLHVYPVYKKPVEKVVFEKEKPKPEVKAKTDTNKVTNTKKQLPNKPVEKVDQSRLKPGVYKAQWKQNPVTGTWYQDEALDLKGDSTVYNPATGGYSKSKYAEGGYIELDLTPEEIQQYKDGGYIVEDISVPTLTKAQIGLIKNPYHLPAGVQHPMQVAPKIKKKPVTYKPNYDPLYDTKTTVSESTKPIQTFNPNLNIKQAVKDKKEETEIAAYLVAQDPMLSEKDKVKILSDPKKIEENIYRIYQENPHELKQAKKQSKTDRLWEYATNPLTALRYSITTGDMSNMPHNINAMRRAGIEVDPNNVVGNTLNDFYNPAAIADNMTKSIKEGDYVSALLDATSLIPSSGLIKGVSKNAIKLGTKAKNVVGNPILRKLEKSAGKYFKPTMHELTNLPTPEELARMNNIERASTIRTYNNSINNPPRLEDFSSVDRFMQQQDIYNQQLKTVQAYIKNSGLGDDDIERIFGRTKEDLLTAKPVTATADQLSLTIQPSSIDLRRTNRVNQLRNQFTQFTSPPTYNFIDQDAINNIASQARTLPNSPMFTSDILNNLPERLSTEQYNDLHNYYNGMLDAHNIDPYALSGSDYDLMHDIYDKLITNQPKNNKLKNTLNQLKVDIATPVNLSDVQAAYNNKRVLQGAKQSDKVKRVVPSFYARDFESPREALEFVQNKLDEGIKNSQVGDIITGSTNTSHDSYRVQMDYIFKNAGKEGLSEPIFLGYERMNDSGFLTEAGIGNEEIIKKINSDLNKLQKRTGKSVNLKSHPPMLDQDDFGQTFIMLPQYGVKKLSQDINKLKKKEEGGPIELELTPEEIQAYRDQGYTVEELD